MDYFITIYLSYLHLYNIIMLLYFQRMYSYNDLTKACKTEEKAGVDSVLTPLEVEEDSIHDSSCSFTT